MSFKPTTTSRFRTLVALSVIGCYIIVSFAQTPGSSTVRKVERDQNGEIIKDKPQKQESATNKSATANSANPSDTTEAALVDYDADLMTSRGDKIMRLLGNVHFHHNGAIIQCDSAFQYDDNRMDFFGRVVIQKDSAFVYGDRVNYDGRTNIADVFAPIVKMTQGTTTLYSYNLQFNTKTNVGVFHSGGVLSQKKNLMESERGSFDGKAEYVRFLENVSMRNDDYIVRTDSLGYDFDTERVDFLGRTYIWSADSNFLMADYGNYFTPSKTYLFTSNAYAMTPDNEIWADTMRYLTEGRRAFMFSNVQLLDTANATLGFGDWGYYDDSLGRSLMTLKPSVRSWDKGDTSYMKADTILMLTFEAGKSKLEGALGFGEDSISQSIHNSSTPTIGDTTVKRDSTSFASRDSLALPDSLGQLRPAAPIESRQVPDSLADSMETEIDSLAAREQLPIDSLAAREQLPIDSLHKQHLPPQAVPTSDEQTQNQSQPEGLPEDHPQAQTESQPQAQPQNLTQTQAENQAVEETQTQAGNQAIEDAQTEEPTTDASATPADEKPFITADSIVMIDWNEFPYVDRKTRKPASQLPLWEEIAIGDIQMIADTTINDTLLMSRSEFLHEDSIAREQARRDSIKRNEKEKVMRAYHNVRLWSKEYQGKCDSMVSFSIDSTAVMHGEPVLWSKANQITAEQIDLYTKDEEIDWADFTGEPFITQQVVENDTLLFNQATGKRLETYFTNNELDYAYMTGNVQNIYYMDEEREVVALANITCAEMTIIFENREPTRMIWQGQGEGPIFPIDKVPAEQERFLPGFTWQDSIRPKSAYEICQRTERPSQRSVCEKYQRPTFEIERKMDSSKEFYRTAGQWIDRTDIPNVTPEYFTKRNQQLLF